MPATPRDLERLQGVHPNLVIIVTQILDRMPMFVVMGVRTVEEQQALFHQGRSTPGPIVTFKDGLVHRSNHQPHSDGLGYAVDLAFTEGNPFDPTHPWDAYGAAVEAAGLVWGGRWKMVDRPHAELPIT